MAKWKADTVPDFLRVFCSDHPLQRGNGTQNPDGFFAFFRIALLKKTENVTN